MVDQTGNRIRKLYLIFGFALFLFAIFSYFYQYNINKAEDERGDGPLVFHAENKVMENYDKIDKDPGRTLYYPKIGIFSSRIEVEDFLSSQDDRIIADLHRTYDISYSEINGKYYITVKYVDTYEIAEILGERLVDYFSLDSFEVLSE